MLCHNYVTLCYNYVYYWNYTHYFRNRKYRQYIKPCIWIYWAYLGHHIPEQWRITHWHVQYMKWTWRSWVLRMEFQWRWDVGDGRRWLPVNQTRLYNWMNPSACGAFELTAWLLWWAGLIMPVANSLSAPVLSMLWQHTLFASEMMKTNYNKRSYNRFAHQKRCISRILVRAANRHNAHKVTSGFLLNQFSWLFFLLTFRVKNLRGTMSSTRSKKPSQTGWPGMW